MIEALTVGVYVSMGHKFVTTSLLLVCLAALSMPAKAAAQDADDDALVGSFIAKQAKKERAEEYKEARKVMRGDVDGDGREDLVALYTLEGFGGTNLHLQYLAVFISRAGIFRLTALRVVGGKNRRDVELKSVTRGEIDFDTQEYLPKDASCCPSGKGHARYVYRKGKLREA